MICPHCGLETEQEGRIIYNPQPVTLEDGTRTRVVKIIKPPRQRLRITPEKPGRKTSSVRPFPIVLVVAE